MHFREAFSAFGSTHTSVVRRLSRPRPIAAVQGEVFMSVGLGDGWLFFSNWCPDRLCWILRHIQKSGCAPPPIPGHMQDTIRMSGIMSACSVRLGSAKLPKSEKSW